MAGRLIVGLLLAVAALPLGAGVAAAHGGEHRVPGADLPRVLSVEPPVAGLALTAVEGGTRLRLDNRTAEPVHVDGGLVVAPGTSAAFADPRVDAPAWTLPLRVGGLPVTVTGDRVAPTPPDPVPWWSLTLGAALLTVALGRAATEHGPGSAPARGVAAVTVLVVAAHVVHVVGAVRDLGVPPGLATTLAAAGPGVACWLIGLAGAGLVVARHPLGLPACAAAGGLALLLTAFDVTGFHRAVLEFAGPYALDRATTALTVGCGAGLLLTGFAVLNATPAGATADSATPAR
ncbi:MAG: hypothetical protein ACT4RN_19215 [Pseudonocardia sp.]